MPDPITDDDETNPVTEGRLRRFDCSQMTDGGAGVVLVTDAWLRDHPTARPLARIDGWGHRTVGLGLQQKLARSAEDPYVMPHVRGAVLDAFAGPGSPSTTSRGSRCTTASPRASTWRSTTSG